MTEDERGATDDRHLYVAVDRDNRTWRLLEREDGTLCIYYSTADDPPHTKRIVWDTSDTWTDPSRVLRARAERAEQRARTLQRACEEVLAIAEGKRLGTWDDVMHDMRDALKEARS